MESSHELAAHIRETVDGPMWHGPSLGDLLRDVSARDASARPISGAHSIWEIVLHVTVWADVVRARVQREGLERVTPEQDWPAPPSPSADAWGAARARLEQGYRHLSDVAARLDAGALRAIVPAGDHPLSAWATIQGAIEHGTYHGGQIALLKRAIAAGLDR
jgi:uncharacterized damage-inducible protein DinB